MKKPFAIILTLTLLVGTFSACTAAVPAANWGDKISVVTTIFAPYDFVRAIVGDSAEISMLLPPGAESHSFEPTPRDIIKIQECDLFIYVGGQSDAWVEGILASIDTGEMTLVTLMDCVEALQEEIVEGMEHDHDHEEEPEPDEHVWTSPKNAELIVSKITEALCGIDGENADKYRENEAHYLQALDELDAEFQGVVAEGTRKTIVFGDRFPFRYFAEEYGLNYFAAFPGCASETEASAKTMTFLIEKVREEKIPAVFYIEFSNGKIADAICEATGARPLLFHSCHNITREDFQNGVTYLDLMYGNAANLKEALG